MPKIAAHVSRPSKKMPYDMCLKLERVRGDDSPTVISDPDSRPLASHDSIAKTPVDPGTSAS
jgi:hypothetical protein